MSGTRFTPPAGVVLALITGFVLQPLLPKLRRSTVCAAVATINTRPQTV